MYKRNKPLVFCAVFVLCIALVWMYKCHKTIHRPCVNIYLWYNMIPEEVFDSFEEETGIHVVKSFYDSNDILEAKLMTGNSGYDIVFPSFIPYAMRQSQAGIYEKIHLDKLERQSSINTDITDKFIACVGDDICLIPVFYTVIGILYNKKVIKQVFGQDKITYEMIFNPEKLKLLQNYGTNFPSEYIDIFPQIKKYLNLDTENSIESISGCITQINKIKPYVKKFFSSTVINDYMSGETAVAICSSDNAIRIMQKSDDADFEASGGYGTIAIECAAIPKGAKNIENAYKFIDYVLRPDIAQIIVEKGGIFVNTKDLRNNKLLTEDDIKNLYFPKPSTTPDDIKYDKICNRLWIKSITSSYPVNISEQDMYV